MSGGFSTDGDNAYYDALRTKVLADREVQREAAILKAASEREAERERRRSVGMPEEEKKKGFFRRKSSASHPDYRKEAERAVREQEGRKSFGETMANLFFNAGKPQKRDETMTSHGERLFQDSV